MPIKIGPKKAVELYLAEHRRESKLTQAQLESRLGAAHMTVSRWERGEVRVDIDTLGAIAEALWGDSERWEDLLHHPDRPSPNQLLRQLPEDDQKYFVKQLKNAARQG